MRNIYYRRNEEIDRVCAGVCPLLVGCGGDNDDSGPTGEPITCEWFTADNCWRRAANELAECASDVQGSFDATASTCTMEDGGVVRFARPVPEDVDVDYAWDFSVENNGAECGSFRSLPNDSGLVLTTPSGEVRAEATLAREVITCPDGSAYAIGFSDAFECLFELPGIAWSESLVLSVSLTGADAGTLFTCAR